MTTEEAQAAIAELTRERDELALERGALLQRVVELEGSLRDRFAAKAMPECMRAAADHTKAGRGMSEVIARAAIFSYAYADAMLKARKA